jgi:hypothetical protein
MNIVELGLSDGFFSLARHVAEGRCSCYEHVITPPGSGALVLQREIREVAANACGRVSFDTAMDLNFYRVELITNSTSYTSISDPESNVSTAYSYERTWPVAIAVLGGCGVPDVVTSGTSVSVDGTETATTNSIAVVADSDDGDVTYHGESLHQLSEPTSEADVVDWADAHLPDYVSLGSEFDYMARLSRVEVPGELSAIVATGRVRAASDFLNDVVWGRWVTVGATTSYGTPFRLICSEDAGSNWVSDWVLLPRPSDDAKVYLQTRSFPSSDWSPPVSEFV